jgi:hypothetical protein
LDDKIWLLHLAWNFDLRSGEPTARYQWVPSTLSKSDEKFIAVICDRVRAASPPIPYGLDHEGVEFDGSTGQLRPHADGKGMTCASFILAILKCYGLSLLVEHEWPMDANPEWQEWIVTELSQNGAPPEHVEAVRNDVGCRRFTPQEVVAASTAKAWPVPFQQAAQLAVELLGELNAAA